jgi:PAS domain S-box-containing protein
MNAEEIFRMRRRILVIDDNPRIHQDIRKIIGPNGDDALAEDASFLFGDQAAPNTGLNVDVQIDSALQGQEGFALAERAKAEGQPYMMAFVDMRMPPGWDGVETIQKLWEIGPDLQVVICTAFSDRPWHEINKRLGRSANLLILKKPFDNLEVLQLVQALTEKWIVTKFAERRMGQMESIVEERTYQMVKTNEQLEAEAEHAYELEKALRESDERFRKAFDSNISCLAILEGKTLNHADVNSSYLELIGLLREAVIGRTPRQLQLTEALSGLDVALAALCEGKPVQNMEIHVRRENSKHSYLRISTVPLSINEKPFFLLALHDTTELRQLEGELRQVQKLDSIGQLAGGLAHDLNNILAAMTLQLGFLHECPGLNQESTEAINDVETEVQRAANLTRQLLIFSRRSTLQAQVVNLKSVVENMLKMLGRLLGAKVKIQFVSLVEKPVVKADAAMLEQIIMNLALNARDAMNGDGSLNVEISQVELDENDAMHHPGSRSGKFIRLAVTDTGSGMKPETMEHIFEPFFTTKPAGKGTGLGLPTVYGIVQQHQGWIQVTSRPGHGSTFQVFLPAQSEAVVASETKPSPKSLQRGQGTVLLVEDEASVRRGIGSCLRRLGYQVLEAGNSEDAVECWSSHRDQIGLLYTDMVIPGQYSGLDLAQKLKSEKSSLGIIISSGYSIEITTKNFPLGAGFVYLPKPTTSEVIATTVSGCFSRS